MGEAKNICLAIFQPHIKECPTQPGVVCLFRIFSFLAQILSWATNAITQIPGSESEESVWRKMAVRRLSRKLCTVVLTGPP